MKIVHTYINNMYIDPNDENKECFAHKWGLVTLAKANHDVWLICGADFKSKQRKTYIWNNIKVVELQTLIGLNNTSRLLKNFITELKKHKDADIFNTHHYCSFIPEITGIIGFLTKTPTVITYHTTFQGRTGIIGFLERFYSLLMTLFLPLFKKKIFISKHISNLFPFYLCNKKNIHLIYNEYQIPPVINNIKQEEYSALFVGRITYLKGIDIIIKSIPHIKKKIPSFKIRLMGKYEGNHKKKLINLAKKYNVIKNISFIGPKYKEDKWKEFAKSSLLIMPSRNEGFGNVVIEAMLSKIPVITSNQGALPEAGGGKTSIFNIKNPKDLAKKTIFILKNNRIKNQMIKEAYNYALTFTKNNILTKYEKIYSKISKNEKQ